MPLRKILVSGVLAVMAVIGFGCHQPPKVSQQYIKKFQAIVTVVEPKDVRLYESLLPKHKDLTMPEKPLVGIYAAYFPIPGVEFAEAGVVLRCKFKGQEAWTLVSNCVDRSESLIYYAARAGGFPKFKADRVMIMPSFGGWEAKVEADNQTWLALNFAPQTITGILPDWQSDFISSRKYQLQDGLILLIPPRKGPTIYKYDLSALAGTEGRKVDQGLVKVVTDSKEEWTKLITPGATYPGLLLMDK